MDTLIGEQMVARPQLHSGWPSVATSDRASSILFPAPIVPEDITFMMLDEMVKRAIQDATQAQDLALRWEALAWLWVCCPDVADQFQLPWPTTADVQQQATAYLERYPTL
ncbi:MAG: hypothetical protein KF832_11110 [Caldilineaceae bacterium]|nr:hypothetical protein [Caldilineaceae bacterium]